MEPTPLQRALAVAPDRTTAGKARPEQEFFCFRVGNLQLGVPSENVREVVRLNTLTPLPRTPAFILGVAAHRGEVFPVLDLLRFLSKGEARIGPRTRLFVGMSEGNITAVVADAVLGLKRFALADIQPPPVGGDAGAEHLLGVTSLNARGGEGVSLINFPKLIAAARLRAVAR